MSLSHIFWILDLITLLVGPQIRATQQRAVACQQLAQGCYLILEWIGVEPATGMMAKI